jgi:hypothetical protein
MTYLKYYLPLLSDIVIVTCFDNTTLSLLLFFLSHSYCRPYFLPLFVEELYFSSAVRIFEAFFEEIGSFRTIYHVFLNFL